MEKPKISSQKAMELEGRYGSFNYAPLPVVFSRGKGVYLWDAEGKRYLDFVCGYSAVSQGHCHPKIVKAVQEQAETLTLVSRALYSDQMGPFAEYATRLLGYDRILMMNTGAEAFETGVKFARKWAYEKKKVVAGQAKVIVCSDNFHGRTMGAVSASTNAAHHGYFAPIIDGFLKIPFNDLGALENALKDPGAAAFLVEPIQGEAGVNVPAEGFIRKAYELCLKYNALFIADEIQTGLARTGKLLCCQHEGVKPHITLLAKSLGGGMLPVSAVLADHEIMTLLQPGDHGSTFGGNPMACHVAFAALKVIEEENLCARATEMGEMFRGGVRAFNSPLVTDVRGKGLLNAVALKLPGDPKEADNEFSLRLKEQGLIAKAARAGVFRFAPALVIEKKEMEDALAILHSVLKSYS
jgi:ornithine--oxo-acid transaminase